MLDAELPAPAVQAAVTMIDIPPAPGSSNYPPENIVRDVVGAAFAYHLRDLRDADWTDDTARTLIARRAAAVNRHDIAADPRLVARLVASLRGAVPQLADELAAHAEHGPNPTPDAYAAACAALEKHRTRADTFEALLKTVLEDRPDAR